MNLFGDFLDKYHHLINAGTQTREVIAAELSRTLGRPVPVDAITIRRGVVSVAVSPALKATIFMHKKTILAALAAKMVDTPIRDIR